MAPHPEELWNKCEALRIQIMRYKANYLCYRTVLYNHSLKVFHIFNVWSLTVFPSVHSGLPRSRRALPALGSRRGAPRTCRLGEQHRARTDRGDTARQRRDASERLTRASHPAPCPTRGSCGRVLEKHTSPAGITRGAKSSALRPDARGGGSTHTAPRRL